jgi:uncharacterized membrane protein YfcA
MAEGATMAMDFTAAQLLLVALTAFGAQIVGGLAGYGTGLLMPLVLVPLVGAQAVVPIIGLSAILTNATRVATFRDGLDVRKTLIVTAAALPTTALGAWAYSLLSGRGAAILIGTMLMVLVPLRRLAVRLRLRLGDPGLALSGVGYGFLVGGTSGSGVLLISMLMGAGLSGMQVIATDAAISFLLGFVKTGVFVSAGALPPPLWLLALLIGLMATPGTLVAKWLAQKFSARVHDVILEGAIIAGALVLLARNLAG